MFKPVVTRCWEKFLKLHGFVCQRTKGSHDQWTKKGFRTIPVWGNEKQIPAFHIKTGCNAIGCSTDSFYEWAHIHC